MSFRVPALPAFLEVRITATKPVALPAAILAGRAVGIVFRLRLGSRLAKLLRDEVETHDPAPAWASTRSRCRA